MALSLSPRQLRDEIAEALWRNCTAREIEEVCTDLGLPPPEERDEAFASKRAYVRKRLQGKTVAELRDMARRIADELGDVELRDAVGIGHARGVDGDLRNLIFAADGPKPRIVLADAINNIVDIVENAEYCLVYDRPLTADGVRWGELVDWWQERTHQPERLPAGRSLYRRLEKSLGSGAEKVVFATYAARYGGADGFLAPALIPQVYLHYDPYTRKELGEQGRYLTHQRMDFLLLFPERVRVVIEVDGPQHYSCEGRADAKLYAETVAEDRKLTLAGYEVYRFATRELNGDRGRSRMNEFFEALLARHARSARDQNPPAPSASR